MKNTVTNIKVSVILIILIIISYITGIGCPIRFLYGICCPGCGLTRAYISILHGDLKSAFIFHPLFILPPIVYAIYLSNINTNIKNLFFLIISCIFLIIYFLRLFDDLFMINNYIFDKISNPIYFDLKKGFIYKFVRYFFNKIINII